jgi:hypothetical protein
MNLVKNKQFIAFINSLLCLPLFIAGSQEKKITPIFIEPFKELGKIDFDVKVVLDANNRKFIIKNHYWQEYAVAETLAAEIGKEFINTNQVQIVPKNNILNGKKLKNTTTVHTYIEGEHDNNVHLIYEAITKREHLENIATKHPQLKNIAAFNIFINNRDCHNGNLLLNKKTNQLYVIDFAAAFIPLMESSSFLAARTCNYLQSLNKKELSSEKIKALKHVRKTLDTLSNQYPPEELYKRWIDTSKQANYNPDLCKQKEMNRGIHTNFDETQYLCDQINRLIKNPLSIKSVLRNIARPSKQAEHSFWQNMNS